MSTQTREPLPVRIAVYIALLIVVAITFIPLYWMLVAASLPQEEFFRLPPRVIPGFHFFENLAALEERFPYINSVWNSVFVATVYTVLSLFLCSLAGFAFAKYDFKYQRGLFYFILATLVLPVQIMIIPMYLLMAQFGLLDTHAALILPFLANPVGIFLMRQLADEVEFEDEGSTVNITFQTK
jgi:lactose/L-arabinose transport system permease protein